MYNIKGPSKIVAKTRRGISKNIENYREYNRRKSVEYEHDNVNITNVPKPVFHKNKSFNNNNRPEMITPQHEEIINFINESWNSVISEAEQSCSGNNAQFITYYEEEPNLSLQDFKPFDLESWWGKRLYAYITNSVTKTD